MGRLWLAMVAVSLAVFSLSTEGSAAPPASRLLKENRAFMSAARHVSARVRLQRNNGEKSHLLKGAHAGLEHLLRLERNLGRNAVVELSPEPPPGDVATLEIHRDKSVTLTAGGTAQTLDVSTIDQGDVSTELRLLALALGVTRLDRVLAKGLETKLPRNVMTLDRIDGRMVWAVGGEAASVWLDREVYRPVRLHIGPGVLDKDTWAIKMTYGDDKPGKGWFPHRIQISRNEETILVIHVTQVALSR